MVPEAPARATEREITRIHVGKEELNFLTHTQHSHLWRKSCKKATRAKLFSKTTKLKIGGKKKTFKYHFQWHKNMKYLEIYRTKDVQVLYTENFRTLLRKTQVLEGDGQVVASGNLDTIRWQGCPSWPTDSTEPHPKSRRLLCTLTSKLQIPCGNIKNLEKPRQLWK